MKKTLLFLAIFLLGYAESYSQVTMSTGGIKVEVGKYGRIRLFTPDGTKHLERASILVGTTPTTVFDYQNDATTLETPVLVSNPTQSDFEIYGSYDNTSGGPPDVIEKLNAFGWTNGAYTVVKFEIKNTATAAVDASIGLDIIPYLNLVYGHDTVTFNSTAGVIRFHRGNVVNVGIKPLSAPLSSLYSFEWYDGYSVDTSYWNWMHYGALQPQYASNSDEGPVAITAHAPVNLAAGSTTTLYYAMALGSDEASMLANIALAEQKYLQLITAVEDKNAENRLAQLDQNTPNPFRGSTSITYRLTENGTVNLKVFNTLGGEVATLVNEKQTKGSHTVTFDASNLASGIYYYTLKFNDLTTSNKMILIK
jgi:hypothetical protein